MPEIDSARGSSERTADREVPAAAESIQGRRGLGTRAYALSFAEFGHPLELPKSGAWLLERHVSGGRERDAMGCYPIFSAQNWDELANDLSDIGPRLVSIALVTDPFGEYDENLLRRSFDRVAAFKDHFVADFSGPLQISRHHSYYARKAASLVTVEAGPPPADFCAEWTDLYATLVRRHDLRGIKAFSRSAFERQLSVPGIVVIQAIEAGTLVGAHLWYEQEDVAYSHLAAASERGYQLNCSYAIYSAALEFFRHRVKRIDFGGGAGAGVRDDGLTWFKRGWSNSVQTAYFCGKILNLESYNALSKAAGQQDATYFPSYRSGELA